MKLAVHKTEAWILVNLDDDGTPLTRHGERMVEIEPGRWADPIIAEITTWLAARDTEYAPAALQQAHALDRPCPTTDPHTNDCAPHS